LFEEKRYNWPGNIRDRPNRIYHEGRSDQAGRCST
jgi:hypothetical protein